MTRRYCLHCGRVAHRCGCAGPESRLRRFYQRAGCEIPAVLPRRPVPYTRGVPPQIKRRERAALRRHYEAWFAELVARCGPACQNCGASAGDDVRLVLDHVLPIAKGGRSTPDNLQILCATCNTLKGKLYIDCR